MEVLWSIRGSYQTIWSFPLTNVKWHSVTWPDIMTTPYWSDFVPNSTFYRILSGFHRTFATGVACRQGTLTPPDTWSRPFGTCICSTCWDQTFSELVVILPDNALRISLGTFSILLISVLQIQAHPNIFSRFMYLPPFSGVIYVPLLKPNPIFLVLTYPTPTLFCLLLQSTSIHPFLYFCFGFSYQPLTISLLHVSWRKTHENRHRTYQCSTSSREFEECLNNAGDNTWRKRTQNENRKPVS